MKWVIDPAHSQIQFAVKHLGISTVRGTFQQFSGMIEEDNGKVAAVHVDIDVNSINTGAEQRDGHLKGADFFDTAEYPRASFQLTKIDRVGNDVTASGDLTIRGATHPITLKGDIGGPANDPYGNQKVSATLATTFSRKEWGLVWNVALETGGLLVSDDVRMNIDIQAAPAA